MSDEHVRGDSLLVWWNFGLWNGSSELGAVGYPRLSAGVHLIGRPTRLGVEATDFWFIQRMFGSFVPWVREPSSNIEVQSLGVPLYSIS